MISLCMIVKNEERSLGRCLGSVKDCVDEVVVVDTGSTDRTVEVAKQFGAKVFYRPWDNDFAAARNFSVSKATGDWIFYLDADEELEPDCAARFKALTGHPEAEGYLFQITNLTDSGDSMRHINLRLFRNKPWHRFRGRLHEQIMDAIVENSGGRTCVFNSGINIFHYGYLVSEFNAKNKAERNLQINKMMVEEEPENPFYLYTLGNSLVNLNDIESAAANYQKALKFINAREQYAPSVFIALIACLVRLGRLDEAMEQVERCESLYPDYVDIHYIEGEIYAKLGHTERSRLCFEKCLSLGEQAHGRYTTRTGVGSFLPLFGLAQVHKARGDLKRAIHYQARGLKLKGGNLQDFITLAALLKESLKDGRKVLAVLSETIRNPDKVNERLVLARLLYEIEEYDLSMEVLNESPASASDRFYLKGLNLIKKGLYREAIKSLKQVKKDAPVYQAALQELTLAHWLATPPIDAACFIRQVENTELQTTLQSINDRLLGKPSLFSAPVEGAYFRQTIERLISLKQAGVVLHILAICGFETPDEKIVYLTTPPVNSDRLELAANLALHEMKKGINLPDYYFVLAWYFLSNDELEAAQNTLHQVLAAGPDTPRYRTLLRDIYRRQALKYVIAALETYPDNPEFNKLLIDIQKDALKDHGLKGAH